MIQSLILLALCTPTAAAPLELSHAVQPAEPIVRDEQGEEVPDKRPEIKEQLEKLKGHTGKRGEQDREAVSVIDNLLQEFEQCGPKDKAAIIKGLSRCFEAKRQDLEGGVKNNQLFMASAVALGEMGKDASKTLQKWIGHKKHRKDIALQRRLILSLGKTKDVDGVKKLLDLLKENQNVIVGAAAEALARFDEAPLKMRKQIFNELLKLMMTTKAMVDSDANDIVSREKWDVIAAPIITTLQVLTGHDERKPEAWQRWWNKNKKKDWDEED